MAERCLFFVSAYLLLQKHRLEHSELMTSDDDDDDDDDDNDDDDEGPSSKETTPGKSPNRTPAGAPPTGTDAAAAAEYKRPRPDDMKAGGAVAKRAHSAALPPVGAACRCLPSYDGSANLRESCASFRALRQVNNRLYFT